MISNLNVSRNKFESTELTKTSTIKVETQNPIKQTEIKNTQINLDNNIDSKSFEKHSKKSEFIPNKLEFKNMVSYDYPKEVRATSPPTEYKERIYTNNLPKLTSRDKFDIVINSYVDNLSPEAKKRFLPILEDVIKGGALGALYNISKNAISQKIRIIAGVALGGAALKSAYDEINNLKNKLDKSIELYNNPKNIDDLKESGKLLASLVNDLGEDLIVFGTGVIANNKMKINEKVDEIPNKIGKVNIYSNEKKIGKTWEDETLSPKLLKENPIELQNLKGSYKDKKGNLLVGENAFNNKLIPSMDLSGASIQDVIKRIPKDAQIRELNPIGSVALAGIEYAWKNKKTGDTWIVRIHEPDKNPKLPKDSNSASGNVFIIEKITKERKELVMDNKGVFHDKDQVKNKIKKLKQDIKESKDKLQIKILPKKDRPILEEKIIVLEKELNEKNTIMDKIHIPESSNPNAKK